MANCHRTNLSRMRTALPIAAISFLSSQAALRLQFDPG
jgi:hypothetical protein